ncbi:hypothetical protein [Haliangium ochraceum]|uniref:Uncharacterized protein n=1 Tax=Haliangium ochraceum (strain DSM 14365 / JCM 11303 / SMP-2) TaxID=502025 RepID=D0LKB3_HALO1|nr:hypothetical protein [Haliangium ochraceum]ACY13147.1 hypothetical protein Hoch_0508 [Haliangium ochraceum DSM 14365]
MSDTEQERKKAERAARERFERAMTELRDGSYRFASRARGQAALVVEELIDPEGEAVAGLADVEGDAGALALAIPLEVITFETWLLAQIGDEEALDLENTAHWEFWFNFGAWIGETLRRRHGGHWLIAADDPKTWRLGFSKIMLEIAPFRFAEQLLQIGAGTAQKLIAEIERLRLGHEEQKARDGGEEIDRFTAQTYIRLHTVPLGQWMAMDFPHVARMWNQATVRDLVKEIKKVAKQANPANLPLLERLVQAIEQADPMKPLAEQTNDRALFETIAQVVGLRRATAPLAMDVIERFVLPAVHIGIPDSFPPLDEDDLELLRKGAEFFALFVEVVPHKYQAADDGFLRSIPQEDLASPYRDRTRLDVGKGDWVIVNPRHFKQMLMEFDSQRMLEKFDSFVTYVRENPAAPRRRDDGRMLVETVARAVADLQACTMAASKDGIVLVFRMLPPPP